MVSKVSCWFRWSVRLKADEVSRSPKCKTSNLCRKAQESIQFECRRDFEGWKQILETKTPIHTEKGVGGLAKTNSISMVYAIGNHQTCLLVERCLETCDGHVFWMVQLVVNTLETAWKSKVYITDCWKRITITIQDDCGIGWFMRRLDRWSPFLKRKHTCRARCITVEPDPDEQGVKEANWSSNVNWKDSSKWLMQVRRISSHDCREDDTVGVCLSHRREPYLSYVGGRELASKGQTNSLLRWLVESRGWRTSMVWWSSKTSKV